MKYTSSLFDSIKGSLAKKEQESGFSDFLKTEMGKTYVVRLLPNIENPERTFFHYYHHLWDSILDGKKTSVLCPATYEERCPIDEYRSKVYKKNNEADIKAMQPIRRNENWLVNVFVVTDPTNPENEGQVKILRYGKQLAKIIDSAVSGDDAEEFGSRIFDASPEGVNLRIKCDKNEGGFPTYVASKFLKASALPGVTDVEELYSNIKSLDTIFTKKSYEEIKEQFNTHWLGTTEKGSDGPKDKSPDEEADAELEEAAKPDKEDTNPDAALDKLIADL